jgi:hypothetical protein
VSRVSPDNITENQIDHIAINKRLRRSLSDARNKREADIGSDIADFRLKRLTTRKKYETKRKDFKCKG